jgi:REP element-mobilizing transposase RayT
MSTHRSYPQRKSPRLQGYNYALSGAYFVTICTHERACLFGAVNAGEMQLSRVGQYAASCWLAQPEHFANVDLDAWVMMPNHLHGILVIDSDREPSSTVTLGAILNTYKGAVTRMVRRLPGCAELRVWQGRYHDHIIRDEGRLNTIRQYVMDNPARWQEDIFYT